MRFNATSVRRNAAAAMAVGASALVAVGNAYAGPLSDGFGNGFDTTDLLLIGAAVMVGVGITFLINRGRKSGGG